MNKTIIFTMVLALMGGMVFAGGEGESSANDFGSRIERDRELEIISIKGDIATDSYGNHMISQNGKNYLVHLAPTLEFDLEEGTAVEGEGVVGRTVYTKDGKEYKDFYLTLVEVDGETKTVDLDKIRNSRAMGRRGSQENAMGGRSSMGRDFSRDRTNRDFGAMRNRDFNEMEEITIEGTISLYQDEFPMIMTNEGHFVLMLGRDNIEDLKEGVTVEATGFTGHTLYSDGGEDYYAFMVTSAIVDGEEVELDHTPLMGRDGYSGSRQKGMMPRS